MKVILSIKPEFADKIFSGTKKFEFRRVLFKRKDVTKVLVYASSPISKIIGEFEIDEVFFDGLKPLWKKTSQHSGITLDYYNKYFNGKEHGYAIKVKNPKLYDENLCIRKKFGLSPPQSFVYIEE